MIVRTIRVLVLWVCCGLLWMCCPLWVCVEGYLRWYCGPKSRSIKHESHYMNEFNVSLVI